MPMTPRELKAYEAAAAAREIEHADWRAQDARQEAQREQDKIDARRAYLATLQAEKDAKRQAHDAARDRAAEASIAAYRTQARAAFPGTAAQFEAAWPAILQQWQLDQTRSATNQLHVDLLASGRYDGF